MKLEETLFPVTEIKIPKPEILMDQSWAWTDPETNKPYDKSGWKMIIRQDTGEPISIVSEDYKLLSNTEMLETALPLIKEAGGELKESQVFSNARSKYTFDFPKVKAKVGVLPDGKDDILYPRITLRNSYDRSLEASFIAGILRLVCSNGMTVENQFLKKSNKHLKSNPYLLSEMEENLETLLDYSQNFILEDLPVFTQRNAKEEDIQTLIKMFPGYVMNDLTEYIINHDMNTYWDLLNAATWVVSHKMPRNKEATHELERSIYPTISKFIA